MMSQKLGKKTIGQRSLTDQTMDLTMDQIVHQIILNSQILVK